LQDIKYIYSGKFNINELYKNGFKYDNDNDDDYKDHDDVKVNKNKIIADISNLKLNPCEIKFISNININIINRNGFNTDHRGLDHTLIRLPFLTEINLGKEFTLEDLIIANTNLKSHKFDNWYELYCGAKCEKKNNLIEVSLDFDHGS